MTFILMDRMWKKKKKLLFLIVFLLLLLIFEIIYLRGNNIVKVSITTSYLKSSLFLYFCIIRPNQSNHLNMLTRNYNLISIRKSSRKTEIFSWLM